MEENRYAGGQKGNGKRSVHEIGSSKRGWSQEGNRPSVISNTRWIQSLDVENGEGLKVTKTGSLHSRGGDDVLKRNRKIGLNKT